MRLKVPFFGYVLAVIGFVLPSVIFAAFLPSLMNTQPVKDRLLSELNEWSGGQVKIAGKVTVESFFSLSLRVEDVTIEKLKSLPRLKGLHAREIIARIAWFDLLRGNLDFDKLKIDKATIKAQFSNPHNMAGNLLSALSEPHKSPFAVLLLTDAVIALRDNPRQPYRKVQVESAIARVDPDSGHIEANGNIRWSGERVEFDVQTQLAADNASSRVPLQLKIDSAIFAGEFDGTVAISAPWWAEGQISTQTRDFAALAEWLDWTIPGISAPSIGIEGAITLSERRLNLESAAISMGPQSATGNLSLALARHVPHLQGSLAFDAINLDGIQAHFKDRGKDTHPARTVAELLSRQVDLDLLISAGRLSIEGLQTGRAAFALNSRAGRVFADIAELALFDGSVRGHVELGVNERPVLLRARLSGDDLRAAELLRWANHQDWISGRANANAILAAEWDDQAQNFTLTSADARIGFPDGGRIKINIPQLAGIEASTNVDGWQRAVAGDAEFDALRFKLTLNDKMLNCANLEMVNSDNFISGDGQIDLAKELLDWRFIVAPVANVSLPVKAANKSGISVQGSWANPVIRAVKISNSDLVDQDDKSALSIEAEESLADVR